MHAITPSCWLAVAVVCRFKDAAELAKSAQVSILGIQSVKVRKLQSILY
jgi:hypothetical protein